MSAGSMRRLKDVVFITGNYPSPAYPNRGTFVAQFVAAVAAQGVHSTVIHPWKVHQWIRERRAPLSASGDGIRLLRPLMLSVSNKKLGVLNTFEVTHRLFRNAVWRSLQALDTRPDALYGHFLYSAGEAAVWAGRRMNLPSFAAVGEGEFWTVRPLGAQRARGDFQNVTGVIAVSSLLKRKLQQEIHIPGNRIGVFPNGVDLDRFYPRPREAMRQRFGLPPDLFIVAYVGNFIEQKGVGRVAAAIDGLPGVGGVFVGSGPVTPRCSNLLFCDRVSHEKVPEILSAADCFVLPSDVEGSSNATIEAMACGLPVVVSEGEFNDEIVDDKSSLRVRCHSIDAIRAAVCRLALDHQLRRVMGRAASARSKSLSLAHRAEEILSWMAGSCRLR